MKKGLTFILLLAEISFSQTLGTPTLSSPANGATNQAASITLTWNAVSGASSYELQISTMPSLQVTIYDQRRLTDTSKALTFAYGTTYYWRVMAADASGGVGPWSVVWHFTIKVGPPAAPILLSPANGTFGYPQVLSWSASTGATSYDLQLSTTADFSSISFNGVMTTTSAQMMLQDNTTYYWRVNATGIGGTSPWSTVWNFTTPPIISVKVNPRVVKTFNIVRSDHILQYSLPVACHVNLAYYNLTGKTVYEINQDQESGLYTINIPMLAKGIYIQRFEAGNFLNCQRVERLEK